MKRTNKDLIGRWAVVTGAEGGIGSEFCKALAARGASILMIGIQDGPLAKASAEIAASYHVDTYPLRLDLTEPGAVDAIMSFLDEHGISPYILINNAGIFSFRPVLDTPAGKLNCFIDLHMRAVMDLTVAFARKMTDAGEGRILNMSSMSCWMPMPGIALYSATKAFIRVFSRALYYELKGSGVTVTVACPGGIATDLFGLPDNLKRLAVRIGAIAKPDSFAKKAVKRMLKGKKQYINGLTNRLAIFFLSLTPTCLRLQIKKQLLDKGITR
ncbi:MAG: SDR family NAD(P)-dependent oxidoreductase [Muribaculum sp.]|nr:SDR family NAD(P)-dependent oxidoreductase [Muribaculum sp.]